MIQINTQPTEQPIQETVCHFGPQGGLFGILTTPDDAIAVEDAPIALILNAGIVHRVGPFRLHVDLARQLADAGYSTLRLDLSGLGDSAQRTGKIDTLNRAELDVRDAMDHLQKETGVDRFVIIGLCSGAYNAHQVSVTDDRIVGSVFMDGIVFRTLGFFWRHKVGRMLKPRFWRNAIKRRLTGENSSDSEGAGQTLAEGEFFGEDLDKDLVIRDLESLMNRGVRMLFLYTDGYDDICGRSQFKEMYGLLPDEGQLQVEYYPKSEHTFRIIENREAACGRVTSWMTGQFGM
jgi:pimeloyl-ACP methyl ester carboxylesterase